MNDPRPDLPTAADAIFAELVNDRAAGRIPASAHIGVLIVPDVSLCVCLEGLNPAFLYGEGVEPLAAALELGYTTAARAMAQDILATIRKFLPRKESGELRHYFDVHLLIEFHARTQQEGVHVLHRKDTRR